MFLLLMTKKWLSRGESSNSHLTHVCRLLWSIHSLETRALSQLCGFYKLQKQSGCPFTGKIEKSQGILQMFEKQEILRQILQWDIHFVTCTYDNLSLKDQSLTNNFCPLLNSVCYSLAVLCNTSHLIAAHYHYRKMCFQNAL